MLHNNALVRLGNIGYGSSIEVMLTLSELAADAECAFQSVLGESLVLTSCETVGEAHYRGGFRLTLSSADGTYEILYSDMQLEVTIDGRQLFGAEVHEDFAGNMFSREHLREYLPRIAASVSAALRFGGRS